MPDNHPEEMVMSYTRVRMALGILGLSLPVFLLIGGWFDRPDPGIAPTISDFYHTTYRDIFVGTLCAIGVFLISYRGYRREPGEWIDDDWLATTAGVASFGLALMPTETPAGTVETFTQRIFGVDLTPVLHYSCALVFFLSIALFCLVKFARTARPGRRRIYQFCGWLILAMLILTAVAAYFKRVVGGPGAEFVLANKLIFWFEAIGIWAFGLAWLVKSRADLQVFRRRARRAAQAAEGGQGSGSAAAE
ncbi:MAG: hypothetical protein KDK26_08010 [Roseivivax sp.]|nr:hypothetical protein [Roseivivax sp.]